MWTPRGRRVFNQLLDYHLFKDWKLPEHWNAAFMAGCWASDLDVEPT